MPQFSKRSMDKLNTCDTDLIRLFLEVVKHRDCTILEGHRNKEDQNKYYAEGKYYNDREHNVEKSKKWYQKNKEYKLDYDKEYYKKNKIVIDEKKREYRKKNPDKYLEMLHRNRAKNPEGDRARHILNYHVEKGEIAKACICETNGCNRTDLHGHHDDYSQPLNVRWVCPKHHHDLHRNELKG